MGLKALLDQQQMPSNDELVTLIEQQGQKISELVMEIQRRQSDNLRLISALNFAEKQIKSLTILLSKEKNPEIIELKNQVILEALREGKDRAVEEVKKIRRELERTKEDYKRAKNEIEDEREKTRLKEKACQETQETVDKTNKAHNRYKKIFKSIVTAYVLISLGFVILLFAGNITINIFTAWLIINLLGVFAWNVRPKG